ncbi:hypothetical protein XELAEV_18000175mg [Xenopus laevis]|uniref:Uncharacterized protein n=1 Tax=Xenopus laevis TaxID=8355 RepID=A0A974BPL4_XENLA|nr:hypothetical protein XELAEV_18000175mg [Xenopus laevis]
MQTAGPLPLNTNSSCSFAAGIQFSCLKRKGEKRIHIMSQNYLKSKVITDMHNWWPEQGEKIGGQEFHNRIKKTIGDWETPYRTKKEKNNKC